MKKFEVYVRDTTYGSWIIEAENESEAKDVAEKRLQDGDITWRQEGSGECEVYDVDKGS